MSYKSVAEIYRGSMEFSQHLAEMEEDYIVTEIGRQIGVSVDKEELLKALKYDRQQYDAGYKDGFAEAQSIKAKYDALVKYLEKYVYIDDAVCDAMSDLYEGDKPYCEVHCRFSEPNATCIDKFAELLARDEVE